MRTLAILASCLALAACVSQPRPAFSDKVIERALKGAPGEAQPSRIVAAELAFARAARDDGQWTAFRQFAAPGAILHSEGGAIEAGPWLATQSDPAVAVQWAPREIWMSCDATLAVSTGRYRDAKGQVGSFVTVWQRQSDGEYRWVYDTGSADNPQPPPRPGDTEEGDIVVTGIDAVRGHVGDCARGEAAIAPTRPADIGQSGGVAADGTLWWRWGHAPDGSRSFRSAIWQDGAWVPALTRDVAPARAP